MSTLKSGQSVNVGRKTLSIEEKLGSGAFGTVYRARDVNSGDTCALKTINFTASDNSKIDLLRREVRTLQAARHKYVVQILGNDTLQLSQRNKLFLILTEYCAGGDLNSRLNKSSTNDKDMKWILQISEALSYLHSLTPAIVHRDLKADNVLITNAYNEDLKLGDFGLAREYVGLKNIGYDGQSMETYYMTSGCGPIHWVAPEFFKVRYTDKADVFSLGGIFYAILERSFHWCGSKKMYGVFTDTPLGKMGLGRAMAFVDAHMKVQFTTSFRGSNSMKRVIEDMLEFDPHNRPSANEVYERLLNIKSSIKVVSVQQQSSANDGSGGCC